MAIKYNRTSVWFATQMEALAYRAGVEFVNDSALEVIGIQESRKRFRVLIYDSDSARDYATVYISKAKVDEICYLDSPV